MRTAALILAGACFGVAACLAIGGYLIRQKEQEQAEPFTPSPAPSPN